MTYADAFVSLEGNKDYREAYAKIPLTELHEAITWLKSQEKTDPGVLYFAVIEQMWLGGKFSEEHAAPLCEMLHRSIEIKQANEKPIPQYVF